MCENRFETFNKKMTERLFKNIRLNMEVTSSVAKFRKVSEFFMCDFMRLSLKHSDRRPTVARLYITCY